ncbi:uncharacterized protein LOC110974908 isoform X2 [Acanthaster planci]|uniref:Uncharacterized protein LOC110974908 isoform X2 n=1 Tax=Acanthaster planci TaxID=133434 RepID=A0A8B7XP17_ACAPL|nr:uncharacterized protein LOC110974908 isoform X2 [Acanthaster planci]
MRRVVVVLLLWLCSACVLTTVLGRSLPWLKDTAQKRGRQIDIQCELDIRNCDRTTDWREWHKANDASRSRQRDRIRYQNLNKRRLTDILQRKEQELQDGLDQNRRR